MNKRQCLDADGGFSFLPSSASTVLPEDGWAPQNGRRVLLNQPLRSPAARSLVSLDDNQFEEACATNAISLHDLESLYDEVTERHMPLPTPTPVAEDIERPLNILELIDEAINDTETTRTDAIRRAVSNPLLLLTESPERTISRRSISFQYHCSHYQNVEQTIGLWLSEFSRYTHGTPEVQIIHPSCVGVLLCLEDAFFAWCVLERKTETTFSFMGFLFVQSARSSEIDVLTSP